jgi:hypothetical protein
MVFICDFCPENYREMIEKLCPFEKDIHFTTLGQNGTSLFQYELAKSEYSNDDNFLFQECDYIWRVGAAKIFMDAVKQLGLVSPYDHPDFYTRYDIQQKESEITLVNETHFRTAKRNTMTFGMSKEAFDKSYDVLMKHGYLDGPVWDDLRSRGYKMWVPIPGMATHMVRGMLSPGIPWKMLWGLVK